MNKKIIIAAVAICVLILGAGSVFAAGQLARSNAISEADAVNFVCVDANLSPENIMVTSLEFEYDHGKFVYEIEFLSGDTKYDYTINAVNGQVIKKNTETIPQASAPANPGSPAVATDPIQDPTPADPTPVDPVTPAPTTPDTPAPTTPDTPAPSQGPAGNVTPSAPQMITADQAQNIALSHAGLSAGSVTFKRTKTDYENGRLVYEVEFYVAGVMEYEYDIDAYTGEIVKYGFDAWENDDWGDLFDDDWDD